MTWSRTCASIMIAILVFSGLAQPLMAKPAKGEKPLILPFGQSPGPDTWLLVQAYGNTVGAYRQRKTTYRLGQGIHFGVDFGAPCGTPVVAAADGVVFAVDQLKFGSAPHNLIIDHPALGYATLYGHLRERPALLEGQTVKQGQLVALSGDPAETCYGRPHLHLELRDLRHAVKYNPVELMQADWDNLALVGPFDRGFERDLAAPRKWQQLDDQPESAAGGPLINDFARPWPPDLSFLPQASIAATKSSAAQAAPAAPAGGPTLRRLTAAGCCTRPTWSADGRQVLFIDKPAPGAPLGYWGVDVTQPVTQPHLVTERIAVYTPDMAFVTETGEESATIERLEDGKRWEIPSKGQPVSLSPGRTRVLWQIADELLQVENRTTELWTANLDGSEARKVQSLPRGRFSGWISDDMVLISSRASLSAKEQVLYSLSLQNGELKELARAERLRSEIVSPDGQWVVYMITFDPAQNGVWLVRTDGTKRQRLDLTLFGSYQWRDDHRLLVVPLKPKADSHELWEVDAEMGETRRLTDPADVRFKIANADAAISPDGRYLVFVESQDRSLWLLSLP